MTPTDAQELGTIRRGDAKVSADRNRPKGR